MPMWLSLNTTNDSYLTEIILPNQPDGVLGRTPATSGFYCFETNSKRLEAHFNGYENIKLISYYPVKTHQQHCRFLDVWRLTPLQRKGGEGRKWFGCSATMGAVAQL